MFSLANTYIAKLASPRKVFAVLVERDGHDAIGRVESFFNTIAVVDVNVDVEDAVVEAEKLKDTQDDVCKEIESAKLLWGTSSVSQTIDIAESAGFALLGVMETASPVDGNITFAPIQSRSTLHAATGADSAELEKAVKDWTIVSHIKASLLFCI